MLLSTVSMGEWDGCHHSARDASGPMCETVHTSLLRIVAVHNVVTPGIAARKELRGIDPGVSSIAISTHPLSYHGVGKKSRENVWSSVNFTY